MNRTIWAMTAALTAAALAQTKVDLKSQSKTVDFSATSLTKPMETGATLPQSCTPGQMFFRTSSPAGQNLYGCASANIWSLESAGGTNVTVNNANVLVGSRPTLDFSTGQGAVEAISDTGSAIAIQSSIDTAFVQTKPGQQAGTALLCASTSAGPAHQCSLTPTLTAYSNGMVLYWSPDANPAGAITLNVDLLGAVGVKLADGAADPAPGDLVAGRLEAIWYDGSKFRLLNHVVPAGALGDALPACGVAVRGRIWFVAGAPGVKDSLSVCAKDASDGYAWRTLY